MTSATTRSEEIAGEWPMVRVLQKFSLAQRTLSEIYQMDIDRSSGSPDGGYQPLDSLEHVSRKHGLDVTEVIEQIKKSQDIAQAREISVRELRIGLAAEGSTRFEILASDHDSGKTVNVLPDLATCTDCREELFDPANRRFEYPFTNCTNCGPRYTIVVDIPYDRPNTTMRDFVLCPRCREEYENPANRRFHAQPNACPVCGPKLDGTIEDAVERSAAGRDRRAQGHWRIPASGRRAQCVRRWRGFGSASIARRSRLR